MHLGDPWPARPSGSQLAPMPAWKMTPPVGDDTNDPRVYQISKFRKEELAATFTASELRKEKKYESQYPHLSFLKLSWRLEL